MIKGPPVGKPRTRLVDPLDLEYLTMTMTMTQAMLDPMTQAKVGKEDSQGSTHARRQAQQFLPSGVHLIERIPEQDVSKPVAQDGVGVKSGWVRVT